jgi:hypothetical protein
MAPHLLHHRPAHGRTGTLRRPLSRRLRSAEVFPCAVLRPFPVTIWRVTKYLGKKIPVGTERLRQEWERILTFIVFRATSPAPRNTMKVKNKDHTVMPLMLKLESPAFKHEKDGEPEPQGIDDIPNQRADYQYRLVPHGLRLNPIIIVTRLNGLGSCLIENL